jgi:hypothetical protein
MRTGKKALIYLIVGIIAINWGVFGLVWGIVGSGVIDEDEGKATFKSESPHYHSTKLYIPNREGVFVLRGKIECEGNGNNSSIGDQVFTFWCDEVDQPNYIGNVSGDFELRIPEWANGEILIYTKSPVNVTYSMELFEIIPTSLYLTISLPFFVLGAIMVFMVYREVKLMRKELIEPWGPEGVW